MSIKTECEDVYKNKMNDTQRSLLQTKCPTLYKQYQTNCSRATLACLWAFTRLRIPGTTYNQGKHGNVNNLWKNPPSGDCSQFTYACWLKAGVKIGSGNWVANSSEQKSYGLKNAPYIHTGGASGTWQAVQSGKVYIGDVFWYPGHVDLYVGDGKKISFGYANGLMKNGPETANGQRSAGACQYILQWGKKYGTGTGEGGSGIGKVKKEVWDVPKYTLTDAQKKKLAAMVYAEGGYNQECMDAVASHMCNLWEYGRYKNTVSKSFYAYISTTHWYASDTRNNSHYNAGAIQAVEKCIINGNRTLPPYVDEFDMYPGDIENPKKISEYVQGKSPIHNTYGSSGTYYCATVVDSSKNAYGKKGNLFFYQSSKYRQYCEQKYRKIVYEDGSTSSAASSEETQVQITTVTQKATWGKVGTNLNQDLLSWTGKNFSDKVCELLIQQDRNIILPPIEGEINFTDERGCSCSSLTFNVLNVDGLTLKRGYPVRFRHNGENVFYGYIFTTKQENNDLIKVTAYDQLRYLKNPITFVMEEMTYAELLKYFCKEMGMKTGSIATPKHKMERAIQDGKMLDICSSAYDDTIKNEGTAYVLYDKFGAVTLSKIEDMMLDILLDKNAIQDYEYESSIDTDVYNQIILAYDNGETGARELYTLNNQDSQNQWGRLSYYEKMSSSMGEADIKKLAEQYMNIYNIEQRTLSYKNVIGDNRVRGGSSFYVKHQLHDYNLKTFMIVEKVTHKYNGNEHWMDLTMIGAGGDFVAE